MNKPAQTLVWSLVFEASLKVSVLPERVEGFGFALHQLQFPPEARDQREVVTELM